MAPLFPGSPPAEHAAGNRPVGSARTRHRPAA